MKIDIDPTEAARIADLVKNSTNLPKLPSDGSLMERFSDTLSQAGSSGIENIQCLIGAGLFTVIPSIIRSGYAHKREAELLQPGYRSWDNFLLQGVPKGIANAGVATGVGIGAASLLGAPFLYTAAAAGYLLHARGIEKRRKNIENANLTKVELDTQFSPGSTEEKKLDSLWNLYQKAESGDKDAITQLYSIPGFGDETVNHNLRKPIDIQRTTRNQIFKILRFILPRGLPKNPDDIKQTDSLDDQKKALFNTFIRNISNVNPYAHNRWGIPFCEKGVDQHYYTAEDSAKLILESIELPKSLDDLYKNHLDATKPEYWLDVSGADGDKEAVIESILSDSTATRKLVPQMIVMIHDKNSQKYLMYSRVRGTAPAEDVNFSLWLLSDVNNFKKAYYTLLESDQKEVLNLLNDGGNGEKIVRRHLNKKYELSKTKPPAIGNTENKRINANISEIFGKREGGVPAALIGFADAGLQFLPFVPEKLQDIGNLVLAAVQHRQGTKLREIIKKITSSSSKKP